MYFILKVFTLVSKLARLIKKRLLPDSLLLRFVLIIIIPTLIGQFLALHLFYERHWYNVSNYTSSFITSEIKALFLQEPFNQHPNEEKSYLNLSYTYLKNQKIPLRGDNSIEELEILKSSLNKKVNHPNKVSIDKNNRIKIFFQVGEDVLIVSLPSKILINPTTEIFVLWVIFLTILLLSVSLIFSKNQIKSILDLTSAAEKYGRGEALENYKPSGAREIRRAGLAVIKMKDRIERQTLRRTQMLAMISHDLKTPLTRMKLQVELMENLPEREELNYDINSMQYMIASYLDFARGEGGENFIEVELGGWIENYVKSYWNNFKINLKIQKSKIYTKIKPHSFTRALDNIISNATKYSAKIKINVYFVDEEAVITIEDNGIGIKENELKMVFKPFYRGDTARSLEDSSSVGLGLTITKEIILGHYGTISLGKSNSLKGLKVEINIPSTTKQLNKK